MGDKSCYMGAGGYQCNQSNGSGYAREEYANSGSAAGGANNNAPAPNGAPGTAPTNPPGVFKARTDQSCYMGPN